MRPALLASALVLAGCFAERATGGGGTPDAAPGAEDAEVGARDGDVGATDGDVGPATDGDVGPATDGDVGPPPDRGAPMGCGAAQVCVPAAPAGWSGPFAVGEAACAGGWPTLDRTLFDGLLPGAAQCGCGCSQGDVTCGLYVEVPGQGGGPFAPSRSCDSPPIEDACLGAVVTAECNENVTRDIPAPTWRDTFQVCGGGAPAADCDGGRCRPAAAPFDLCVVREGDEACPVGFGQRRVLHTAFVDERDCTECECSPAGAICEVDVEICSLGFFQETVRSDGPCVQLNSSDGDGVSRLGGGVLEAGRCEGSGGQLEGQALPTGPVTVCCL